MAKVRNIYNHTIDLKKITIKNTSRKEFAQALIDLPYRGYEVEDLSDGRKIVLTKPGGKTSYGRLSKEDFLVFIYTPATNDLWQIAHAQILEDLKQKAQLDPVQTKKLIDLFEQVLKGTDPEDIIQDITCISIPIGEQPEALLKAYKWIWGQEDVNYPTGEGRMMSWKAIDELRSTL